MRANDRTEIWAPEVVFSPFPTLLRYHFCLRQIVMLNVVLPVSFFKKSNMLIAASSEELQMVIGHNCFSTAIPTSHCKSQAKIVFAIPGNTLVFKDSTYFFSRQRMGSCAEHYQQTGWREHWWVLQLLTNSYSLIFTLNGSANWKQTSNYFTLKRKIWSDFGATFAEKVRWYDSPHNSHSGPDWWRSFVR